MMVIPVNTVRENKLIELFDQGSGGEPRPQLHLTPERVICGVHGPIFKPQWPKGYPQFVTMCLTALTHCDVLTTIDGDAASIEKLLDDGPMCCRLADQDPDFLLATFKQLDITIQRHTGEPLWRRAKCNRCRKYGAGCMYATHLHKGKRNGVPVQYDHLCLKCVTRLGVKGL